jgi:hypothetical protein
MINLSKQQTDAAQEFATATIEALKMPSGVHPGTVVAAAARMAGTYLFRSLDLQLPGVKPRQFVLSIEANEQWPQLTQIALNCLARVGIKVDNTQAGKAIDPKHKTMLEFLYTQKKLEPMYAPIKERYGFSSLEAAQSLAVATVLLIRHGIKYIDPDTALNIAVLGFVEGAKTAPIVTCSVFLPTVICTL